MIPIRAIPWRFDIDSSCKESCCHGLKTTASLSQIDRIFIEPVTPSVVSWLGTIRFLFEIMWFFKFSRKTVVGIEGCTFQIPTKNSMHSICGNYRGYTIIECKWFNHVFFESWQVKKFEIIFFPFREIPIQKTQNADILQKNVRNGKRLSNILFLFRLK